MGKTENLAESFCLIPEGGVLPVLLKEDPVVFFHDLSFPHFQDKNGLEVDMHDCIEIDWMRLQAWLKIAGISSLEIGGSNETPRQKYGMSGYSSFATIEGKRRLSGSFLDSFDGSALDFTHMRTRRAVGIIYNKNIGREAAESKQGARSVEAFVEVFDSALTEMVKSIVIKALMTPDIGDTIWTSAFAAMIAASNIPGSFQKLFLVWVASNLPGWMVMLKGKNSGARPELLNVGGVELGRLVTFIMQNSNQKLVRVVKGKG